MKRSLAVDGRELVLDDDVLAPFESELREAPPTEDEGREARLAFAAMHVAMQDGYAEVPHAPDRPGKPDELVACIDWDTTFALRRRLDGLGLGVAEAMDTAQRFELGWEGARRLIEGTGALGLRRPFVAGVSTDHLDTVRSIDDLVGAVCEQIAFVREHGGEPVVLPMPWLARERCGEDDYVATYRGILDGSEGALWLHWLGEMFLPELAGYFPGDSFERILALDRERFRGVKISLLDAEREVAIRRTLAPHGQRVLTGDDFHFARLIAGDEHGCSHALLGVFDGVARPASVALELLARGRRDAFLEVLTPCEAFGQHVFGKPTMHYKAGLAFVAWLNGLQPNPMLPNHLERARDRAHLVRCAELASACGAIEDAAVAADRLSAWLAS